MKTFELFGKTLVVSDKLEAYNALRMETYAAAQKSTDMFEADFKKNNNSMEDIIVSVPEQFGQALKVYVTYCVDKLYEEKVYEYDLNKFYQDYIENNEMLDIFEDAHDKLTMKYISIMEELIGDEALRQLNSGIARASRGKWIGGGFGISGAIMGAAKAGAMNVGLSIVRTIGDSWSDMRAKSKFESRQREIFRNSNNSIRKMYADMLLSICRKAFYGIVQSIRWDINYKYSYQFEPEKARAIALKLSRGYAIPKAEIGANLIEAFGYNPYCDELYDVLLHNFPNNNGEVFPVAAYFGVNLSKHNDYLEELFKKQTHAFFEKYYKNPQFKDLKEVERNRSEYLEMCSDLGITSGETFKDALSLIDKTIQKMRDEELVVIEKMQLENEARSDIIASEKIDSRYGNSTGNIANGGSAVMNGGWIYFCNDNDGGKLYKIREDGTGKTRLTDANSYYLNVMNGWIYYRYDGNNAGLYKIRIDGTGSMKLNGDKCKYITVVGDWIYYINESDEKIYKIHADGAEKTKLNKNDCAWCMCVDKDWIFFTVRSDRFRIYKMRIDGTGRIKLHNDGECYNLHISGDWIFYTSKHDAKFYTQDGDEYIGSIANIHKMRTNGTEWAKISNDASGNIHVVGNWVFYSNESDDEKLYKIRVDGKGKMELNSHSTRCINIVGNWIFYQKYWFGNGWEYAFYKIRANGTEQQLV